MKHDKQKLVLAVLIAFEIALFSVTGQNFFSWANFFECIRLAVEIGLLALALTPVIVAGGIDLSVGSMMGLCAVCFGALWNDAHLPMPLAAAITLLVSLAGGAINGFLISRLNVSALVVTLGTYSLFRGLAEAITTGAKNYSGFSAGFLFLGQGYLGGIVPTQTVFLVAAAVGFWALLHRSVIGRGLYTVGHSPTAARYAAVPVVRRVALAYVLSGFSAGVAAIIYIAHLGQAKSDAGTGYELIAITAVILGGASIFGGSGTIAGTLMGLAAIVILQNGLRLSAWPTELAGILTGVLLILTIALERVTKGRASSEVERRELPFWAGSKGRIVALAGLALAVFAIPLSKGYFAGHNGAAGEKRVTIGVMPKAKGDPYFLSCRKGAEEAAKELKVDLIWDGPTALDAAAQNAVVEGWITRHVDAISVAVENGPGISTVLRKARAQGIKVTTWDADALPDARDYFINQATPKAIGYTLIDEAARLMNKGGEFAIITGALSAANQNEWIAFMRERVTQQYPGMKLLTIRPSDDDHDKAFAETQTLLKVYPNIKVIIGISAPAVPGAGEAVKQAGRRDVQVIGLSLPNLCKPYVHDGFIEAVVLWNTKSLGYLAVAVPAALARGTPLAGQPSFNAGRLGSMSIEGSQVILGQPVVFRKDNIDQFGF
ncbi:MAG: substrate-binding domain-containing protein [Acidobacteriaceae bacterium]|nr:substrate-binding domain-containing protein [Acidobacteriaceae bacterium]